jgi:hypothetical protein
VRHLRDLEVVEVSKREHPSAAGDPPRPAARTGGVRTWPATLPDGGGTASAVLDTGMDRGIVGGAAPRVARSLRRRGYHLVAAPEPFAVGGILGPLYPGELERARRWGAALAAGRARWERIDARTHRRQTMKDTMTMNDTMTRLPDPTTHHATDHAEGLTTHRTPEPTAAPGADAALPCGTTVDLTRVVVTAEVVVGAVVVARTLARRSGAPKALVTMGPGGWVSMKGGTVAVRPARRPLGRPRPGHVPPTSQRAPLWARVLSAVPLQALMR